MFSSVFVCVTYLSLQVFGVTNDSHPGLDGHVFPNPIDPNTYVAMLVHKNGSLAREGIISSPVDIFLFWICSCSKLRLAFDGTDQSSKLEFLLLNWCKNSYFQC